MSQDVLDKVLVGCQGQADVVVEEAEALPGDHTGIGGGSIGGPAGHESGGAVVRGDLRKRERWAQHPVKGEGAGQGCETLRIFDGNDQVAVIRVLALMRRSLTVGTPLARGL